MSMPIDTASRISSMERRIAELEKQMASLVHGFRDPNVYGPIVQPPQIWPANPFKIKCHEQKMDIES